MTTANQRELLKWPEVERNNLLSEVRECGEAGTVRGVKASGVDQPGLDLRPVPQEGIHAWPRLGS